ncbi:MAG: hypothetical protein FJW35_15330 [Acidobacteria bacterium]|nr:hypothetical protein [Acidobacteriota bacterium]
MRLTAWGPTALAAVVMISCTRERPAPTPARLGFSAAAFQDQERTEGAFARGLSADRMSDFHRSSGGARAPGDCLAGRSREVTQP